MVTGPRRRLRAGRAAKATIAGLLLLAGLVVVSGLVAVSCSGHVDSLSLPNPSTTVAPVRSASVSLPASRASLSENTVAGVTTTTLPAITPGPDTVSGTVLGPQGPVAGATVEADRFVGDAYRSARTTTAADGSWSFAGVLGGRYRIRAWQAPTLGMSTPQVLFVSSAAGQPLLLQLTQYQSPQVQAAVNPSFPTIGQTANLVVQVVNQTVNANGIETSTPDAGQRVSLVDGPEWQVTGANPAVTDASGEVLFRVSCTVAGYDPLSAQVGGNAAVTLQMPSCQGPTG